MHGNCLIVLVLLVACTPYVQTDAQVITECCHLEAGQQSVHLVFAFWPATVPFAVMDKRASPLKVLCCSLLLQTAIAVSVMNAGYRHTEWALEPLPNN